MSLTEYDRNLSTLYKYRPDNENTINLLKNQILHFSYPYDFNDPFDCKINMVTDGSDEDIEDWLKKLPYPERNKKVVFDQIRQGSIRKDLIESNKKINYKALIVYCLSEKFNNILMWSHYANSHAGICIGIRASIYGNSLCIKTDDPELEKKGTIFEDRYIATTRVKYDIQQPKPYNLFKSDGEDIKPFILRKSKDWEYEAERRILLIYRFINKQDIIIDKNSIKDIYFGCKTSEAYFNKVVEIIKSNYWDKGYNVDIYKMECSSDKYEVIPNKYTL